LTPGNQSSGKPFIQGYYLLFDATDGRPLALIEARALTNMRTAAASALASSYLSRPDSRCLFLVGTGALAPYLARAHAAVRPIETIMVWGRDREKAERVAAGLQGYSARAVVDLGEAVSADVVSCATSTTDALLKPSHLRSGQHIDLVGAFKPTMQELHEDGLAMTRIFVDTRQGALSEAGDILIPLQKGLIEESDIVAELADLASGRHPGRQSADEITLFKSVGHAIEDLVAARLVVERIDGE
jgi:ornithine cyclodeaminase